MSTDHQNTSRASTAGNVSPSLPSKKKPAKKAKAGSSKKMTAKEQSERFIETARELNSDESGAEFEHAIQIVTKARGQLVK